MRPILVAHCRCTCTTQTICCALQVHLYNASNHLPAATWFKQHGSVLIITSKLFSKIVLGDDVAPPLSEAAIKKKAKLARCRAAAQSRTGGVPTDTPDADEPPREPEAPKAPVSKPLNAAQQATKDTRDRVGGWSGDDVQMLALTPCLVFAKGVRGVSIVAQQVSKLRRPAKWVITCHACCAPASSCCSVMSCHSLPSRSSAPEPSHSSDRQFWSPYRHTRWLQYSPGRTSIPQ